MELDQFTSNLPVELIVDAKPHSGRFNMAMDEALLELGGTRQHCVCRVYQWSEPTVTLGYFQAKQEEQVSPFPELPVVRRLSGGGAILHDQELTYSTILPAEHPVRQDPSQLYVVLHNALIHLLVKCGAPCCLRSQYSSRGTDKAQELGTQGQSTESFLCFLRQNPNDIVDLGSGRKVVGSAQRRRKGIILQHGSILLRASEMTPNLLGLLDLHPQFDLPRFQCLLPEYLAATLGTPVTQRSYTEEELGQSAKNMDRSDVELRSSTERR